MYSYDNFSNDFYLSEAVYDYFTGRGLRDYRDFVVQARMLFHYSSDNSSNLCDYEKQLVRASIDEGIVPVNDPSFNAYGCRRLLNLLRLIDFFIVNDYCDRDNIILTVKNDQNCVWPFDREQSYRSTFGSNYIDIVNGSAVVRVSDYYYANVDKFLRLILDDKRAEMLEMLYGTKELDGKCYSFGRVAEAFSMSEQDVKNICNRRNVLDSIKPVHVGLTQDFFRFLMSMFDFMSPLDISEDLLQKIAIHQHQNPNVVFDVISMLFDLESTFTLNYRHRCNSSSGNLYFVGI